MRYRPVVAILRVLPGLPSFLCVFIGLLPGRLILAELVLSASVRILLCVLPLVAHKLGEWIETMEAVPLAVDFVLILLHCFLLPLKNKLLPTVFYSLYDVSHLKYCNILSAESESQLLAISVIHQCIIVRTVNLD